MQTENLFQSIDRYKEVIVHGMAVHKCPQYRAEELIDNYEPEVQALFAAGRPAINLIHWLTLEWRAHG